MFVYHTLGFRSVQQELHGLALSSFFQFIHLIIPESLHSHLEVSFRMQ